MNALVHWAIHKDILWKVPVTIPEEIVDCDKIYGWL
jgi:hypothetical protein